MSRKHAIHLVQNNFMGIADRIKRYKKPRAVTTANKTK